MTVNPTKMPTIHKIILVNNDFFNFLPQLGQTFAEELTSFPNSGHFFNVIFPPEIENKHGEQEVPPPREIKAVFYCIVFFSDIIVNTMQSLKYAM